MTDRIQILVCDGGAVPILLFGDPLRLSPVWFGYTRDKACNVLTLGWENCGLVGEHACRRDMLGPSLRFGGELVVPHEGRRSNGSALAVVHGQDGIGKIRLRVRNL